TPTNPSVVSGFTRQFTATGTYTDGSIANITAQVTWSSSDINVATMNANFAANSGLATGISAGTAGITATLAGTSGNTTLTATAATLSSIAVTPVDPSVVNGLTRQFAATGYYSDGSFMDLTAQVTWSSSDINVATMNASGAANSGLATGKSDGTAAITATLAGKSGSTNLTV
ncbi:MAG: Ig-like domain-containing protein, partial [Candidatus Izemoplasmataceae bacterium]